MNNTNIDYFTYQDGHDTEIRRVIFPKDDEDDALMDFASYIYDLRSA